MGGELVQNNSSIATRLSHWEWPTSHERSEARRVRSNSRTNVVGVLSALTQTLCQRERDFGFTLRPFKFIEPQNNPSEMVQGLGLVHRLDFSTDSSYV